MEPVGFSSSDIARPSLLPERQPHLKAIYCEDGAWTELA
jgi:hypothetical protein